MNAEISNTEATEPQHYREGKQRTVQIKMIPCHTEVSVKKVVEMQKEKNKRDAKDALWAIYLVHAHFKDPIHNDLFTLKVAFKAEI